MSEDKPSPGASSGPAIDRTGTPVIDPTANVLDKVDDAKERLDDLRLASNELSKAVIDGLEKYIDTRIEGFEKLSDARHKNIQHEFDNIESRRIEHKNDTKSAVDTAFASAKEAVKEQAGSAKEAISKSESTVGGQIKAVEGTVDDLKERIGKLETRREAINERQVDNRSNIGMIVGVVGGIIGVLMFILGFAALIRASI